MRGVGVGDYFRDDKWYAERIEIFKNYTLKSLINQENRNFALWLTFRPVDEHNRLTKELADYLKSVKMEYVMTFDGLPYWDDKFSKGFKIKIKNCLRVLRGCFRNNKWNELLPSIWKVLFKDKNSTLQERIGKSVDKIKKYFSDVDIIYLTRIDSDDMFHKSAIKEIQSAPFESEALVFDKGYIYNKDTNQLAEYNPE